MDDLDKFLGVRNNYSPSKKVEANELELPNGKVITFNDEQFEGINKIKKWLKNGTTFFVLAGYAGTGKTTVIKKIIDSYRGGIAVSAPTHKAKKVIMRTTKRDGQTLHGLLGLRPDINLDDFNPNQPQFNPIAPPKITDYNLVIIDEASMINQDLYNLILEKTKNSRTKVLFMGDPAQIPPVGEKESVVFNKNINEFHQLTKIERQNDTNPLKFVYTDLRNNLLELDSGIKRITNINDKGEGVFFTTDKKKFREMVIEKYKSDEFKKDIDFIRLIAWKNNTVMMSNKVIRYELFGDDSDTIKNGDVVMGYRTIMTENMRKVVIENSADYRVTKISSVKKNSYSINGFSVELEEIDWNDRKIYRNVFIIDSEDEMNLHIYAQQHDSFRDAAKSNKRLWKKYYEFRRNNLLMKTIDKHVDGQYRSNYDIIAKDLDYGYAITAHKSQGSTYEYTFVMENDINDNWQIKERNRIKYVALTRPTKSAIVLTTKIDIY